LTQQLGLEREDVIEDAIDPPALETMLGDHPCTIEVAAKRRPQRSIDARLSFQLGVFEQIKAAIEGELPRAVRAYFHLRPSRTLRPCLLQ
jgi:hypothetical protein